MTMAQVLDQKIAFDLFSPKGPNLFRGQVDPRPIIVIGLAPAGHRAVRHWAFL